MRFAFLLCIVFVIFIIPTQSNANTLIQREILGNKAEFIEFQTDSKDFDLKVGIDTKGGSSLREIMQSVGGISGVTGVFQCPKDYSACGGINHTINERYVNGKKLSIYKSTGERVVFGWDTLYQAFIFQTDKINRDREGDIFEGLANHPLLLLDGKEMTDYYWEKGLIDEKMRQKGTRNFICSTQNSNVIYFGLVHKVDIDHLAKIIKKIGCYNAINLDAGYSTAMIHNGTYRVGPGREILDGVFIVPKNINVDLLIQAAKKVSLNLDNSIRRYSKEKRVEILERIILKISDYNNNIYNTRSENIVEQDSSGFDVSVGTRTSLSKKAIERTYILSTLNSQLYQTMKQYKKEISQKKDLEKEYDLKF